MTYNSDMPAGSNQPSTKDVILPHQSAVLQTYQDFLTCTVNPNTRTTYANGNGLFLKHLSSFNIFEFIDIEPKHISEFVVWMNENDYEIATSRLYLSAIPMFFDRCVVDGLVSVNPAKAVKLPRQFSKTGKTPVIVPEKVRQIIDAIPLVSQTYYRDRALIGLMVFSFFRISAALSLTIKDYELRGSQRGLIGEEKGAKHHEMPVHPSLEIYLDEYITFCGITNPSSPLFQSGTPRGGKLTGRSFDRTAAWRMVRRRAKAAEVFRDIGDHSFRATGITAYLNAGGSLEDARIMPNHSNARLPRSLTREDIQTVLGAIRWYPWRYVFEGIRNEAIIYFMVYTGLRLQELLNLEMSDVNIVSEEVLVRQGKGQKDRMVPIHPKLIPVLRNYVDERKKRRIHGAHFFTGAQSEKPLSGKDIRNICHKLTLDTGIYFTPHMLRHTFGRLMVEADFDIYKIKEVMGHSNITTTEGYLTVSTENIKRSFREKALL